MPLDIQEIVALNLGAAIAGIQMETSQPDQPEWQILVEGQDDVDFYQRFYNPAKITVKYNGEGGCHSVWKYLREEANQNQIDQSKEFLICILDADGRHLPGITIKDTEILDNVFFTDTRDWETTVMREITLSSFWQDTMGNHDTPLNPQTDLFRPLFHWSSTAAHCFIRNYKHNLRAPVNFKCFDWPQHIRPTLAETIEAIKLSPSNRDKATGNLKTGIEEALQEAEIADLQNSLINCEPWYLHRGHDLIKALSHLSPPRNRKSPKVISTLLSQSLSQPQYESLPLAHRILSYLTTYSLPNPYREAQPAISLKVVEGESDSLK